MRLTLILMIVCVVSTCSEVRAGQATGRARSAPAARVFALEQLTFPQIGAFDRQRTLFILPVGMIEQHGPHLPIGADTIGVTGEATATATRVARALPDWNVIVMPPFNYGRSGENQLGNMPIHPGTYGIRQSTLRSLVADVGAQIAQNGFKWIFVLNGHGAPTHNIASTSASDFAIQSYLWLNHNHV
jgi:creatinine amidohydrolase